jgi:small subunit ribosomal protein S4
MIIGPKYKICKRLGSGVFEKCQTQKFTLSESRAEKGRGRGGRRPSRSNYALQLLEKQKARYTYGISERQFSNYVKEAKAGTTTIPTEVLYTHLEERLDNVVYRLGLAKTRRQARQLVSHGHILVNGRKVTIPSYQVSISDEVGLKEKTQGSPLFSQFEEENQNYNPPAWLSFDANKKKGVVTGTPAYTPGETFFDLTKVLEFYSR